MELEIEVGNILIIVPCDSISIEIEPRKTLNINPNLSPSQTEQLLKVLREHKEAYSCEYTDMKGILADLCSRGGR